MDDEEWVVEEFYFGSANWPSDARWRRKGTKLQVGVERVVSYNTGDANTAEVLAEIKDFETKYLDVTTKIYPSDGASKETMFLLGWVDRTGNKAAWKRYREDKQYSM